MKTGALLDATWPAAALEQCGPFVLRRGDGGGKRVSAATATGPAETAAIAAAEGRMAAMGQTPLFRIAPEREGDLDARLAGRGYGRLDPTLIYSAAVEALAGPPGHNAFAHWEPLEILRDIWAEGGVDAARQAVMGRVQVPRAAILGRAGDRAAGATFVALAKGTGMVHALEVRPGLRRQGTAGHMLRAAALWVKASGGACIALAVTEANGPARALYEGLGMRVMDRYHYRQA